MPNPPSVNIQEEIKTALRTNEGQLGKVFALFEEGLETARQIVDRGGAANSGAVGNLRCTIRAVLAGEIPTGPTVAAGSARSVGGLLRDNPDLSPEAKDFLRSLREDLEAHSRNEILRRDEEIASKKASDELERRVAQTGGVYVYSLPMYIEHPCKQDPERFWLKVGMTTGEPNSRISELRRATGLPEDPRLLRGYRSGLKTPREIEGMFHNVLDGAEARSQALKGGTEWFATTLELLDSLASAFGFEIEESD